MDDKKQIEEMEELLSEYYENIDESFASVDIAMEIVDRVDYFVNRVQELEQSFTTMRDNYEPLEGECNKLEQQNKRYREALEFIGNHANESDMMDNVMYTGLVKEVIEKALEG